MEGKEKRPGSIAFKPVPKLPVGRRAELTDYKGWNGVYDRGHQCASADSKGRGKTVEFENYLTTINEIERLTGLDFVSSMPDDQEEQLEKETSEKVWEIN